MINWIDIFTGSIGAAFYGAAANTAWNGLNWITKMFKTRKDVKLLIESFEDGNYETLYEVISKLGFKKLNLLLKWIDFDVIEHEKFKYRRENHIFRIGNNTLSYQGINYYIGLKISFNELSVTLIKDNELVCKPLSLSTIMEPKWNKNNEAVKIILNELKTKLKVSKLI